MVFNFRMVAAGVFGLFRFPLTQSAFYKSVLILQCVAIALAFVPTPPLKTTGAVLFALSAFAILMHSLFRTDSDAKKRTPMALTALPVFIAYVSALNHFPFSAEIGMLTIVSVCAFIYVLSNAKSFSQEIGSLTVLAADAAIRIYLVTSHWL